MKFVTDAQRAALDANATLSAENPVASMADVGGGPGGTPTLAEVLAEGADTGENEITGPSGRLVLTADAGAASFYGKTGTGSDPGLIAGMSGGDDAGGGHGAAIYANGADGSGNDGTLTLVSGGTSGSIGDVLTSDGMQAATWQSAFAALLAGLPTVDPGVAGAAWNDGGTLMVSAG